MSTILGLDLTRLTRDGVFSAAHAVAADIDPSELRRLVAAGQGHRLIRGWYALGPVGEPRLEHSLRVGALTQHLGRLPQPSFVADDARFAAASSRS